MKKLQKIIDQLNDKQKEEFKASLQATNSTKFLKLFEGYNLKELDETAIRESLDCNQNAYYVLKSRLYDKIQTYLVGSNEDSGTTASNERDHHLLDYAYQYPIETAIAILNELESRYIKEDSPSDLINVYSVLKKLNFYSDKYYNYSQLYNTQVANALALEKAEETLHNYNRTLANYFFSCNNESLDVLNVLKKEVNNVFMLYKSPRIELIKNIIAVQEYLFISNKDTEFIDEILIRSEEILNLNNNDKRFAHYKNVLAFLQFEYFSSIGHKKKAKQFFIQVEQNLSTWLLHNNNCLAFKFLLSKLEMMQEEVNDDDYTDDHQAMLFDSRDLYTEVIFKFYQSVSLHFIGQTKKAIGMLNDLLNEVSFKNYVYVETEIKLTLAYFYILQTEYELADNLLKSLFRKTAATKNEESKSVKEAVKLFNLLITGFDKKRNEDKFKDIFEQLQLYNKAGRKTIAYLLPELEQKFVNQ